MQASNEELVRAIIDMAVEAWKFRRVFDRAMMKLDIGDSSRYKSQFLWFIKKVDSALETAGLRIVNVEGHTFDIGMAVTPLNIVDFDTTDDLIIEQLVEPIVMKGNTIMKTGTAILGRIVK